MKILLLDLDGVLVEPHGYHQALRETVAIVGGALGYPEVSLSWAEIAAFEAAGVSSEWDSAAMCAALLLEGCWESDPRRRLPADVSRPAQRGEALTTPDFQAFARALAQDGRQELRPLARAERLLLGLMEERSREQRQAIRDILRTARQMEGSFTHRIFQELVLGSELFAQVYGLRPGLEVESFLLKYDRSALSAEESAALRAWMEIPGQRAAIFTGRPSRAPRGAFSTPEAEQGTRLAGLEGIPVAGLGGLVWLSGQRKREPAEFLKPSPVHTLAALRLATGEAMEEAFEAAARLALDDQADPAWKCLDGAEVCVFEDTGAGLASAQAAKVVLENHGIGMEIRLFGIASEGRKIQALEGLGARVFPGLRAALEEAGIGGGNEPVGAGFLNG